MCEYKVPEDVSSEDFETFEDFQQNLELKCERGKPGRLIFKPDENTPDLLYYQCYTHRFLGWKIHVVDSCQETTSSLDTGASSTHLRNVTVNTVTGKHESDYKRGPAKEKPTFSRPAVASTYGWSGNDGIPLELYETEDAEDLDQVTRTPMTTKELYHRPTTKPTAATRNQYYHQYGWASTEATRKPASAASSHGNTKKSSYTKSPERKKQVYSLRNYAVVGSTPRPFPRVVVQTRIPDTIKLYSIDSPTSKEAVYQTREQSVIVTPSKTKGVRVTIFPMSDAKPGSLTTPSSVKTTTRSQTPWWKPIGTQKTVGSDIQSAQQSLKNQLAVIQGNSRWPTSSSTRRPSPLSFQNGFLPLVIKSNGTFERALVDRPPDVSQEYGVASKYQRKANGHKKHVHVLIRTDNAKSPIIRRTNGNEKTSYIKTPVGNFRLPNSPPRRKGASAQSSEESEAFLPLLLPKGQANSTAPRITKQTLPLIPIVVPEKKGDNLYVLHHVMSLITDNPVGVGRNVRIINHDSRKEGRGRMRVLRSADHHMDHSDHDHSDHDHDHSDHQAHGHGEKKSDPSNSAILQTASILQVLLACCIALLV